MMPGMLLCFSPQREEVPRGIDANASAVRIIAAPRARRFQGTHWPLCEMCKKNASGFVGAPGLGLMGVAKHGVKHNYVPRASGRL